MQQTWVALKVGLAELRRRLTQSGTGKTMARGASAALVVKFLAFPTAYLTQVALARWMGAAEYGAYAWIMNLVPVLTLFVGLGYGNAVVRFIPEYVAQADWAKLRGLIQTGERLALGGGLVAAVLGMGLVWLLGGYMAAMPEQTLMRGVWLIPLFVLMKFYENALRGRKRMALSLAPTYVLKPMLIVSGAALVMLGPGGGQLDSTLAITIALGAIALIVLGQAISLHWVLPAPVKQVKKPARALRVWLRVAVPLLFVGGFLQLLNRADILFVGVMLGTAEAGMYNAASKTANMVGIVLTSVNAIAAPMVATLYAKKDLLKLYRLILVIAQVIFWPSFLALLLLVGFAPFLLGLFGESFLAAQGVLVVLALGQMINGASGAVAVLLNMTGHQDYTARVYGWSLLVNIILNVAGIMLFGLIGAAIATALTVALQKFWLRHLTIQLLGVDPTIFAVFATWIRRATGRR